MQIHGPSETPDPARFSAYLNPGGTGAAFAVVVMGGIRFYAENTTDCEAAIRVWT
jgi:hypothetical protein